MSVTKKGDVEDELNAELAAGRIETYSGNKAAGRQYFVDVEQKAKEKGYLRIARKAEQEIKGLTCGSVCA